MITLLVEAVEDLHREIIEVYGGSHGLRDRGLLESAVARAQNKAYYEPDASISEIAASLAWGLIKNHAFIDGNKRIGFAALTAFLKLNAYTLTCSEPEETAAILGVAAGEITEEAWTTWVVQNTAPTQQP